MGTSTIHNKRVFDLVVEHFSGDNGYISYDMEIGGVYKNEKGHQSPIGLLIPTEFYRPTMETLDVVSLIGRYPLLFNRMIEMGYITASHPEKGWRCLRFLLDLQKWHDKLAWQCIKNRLNFVRAREIPEALYNLKRIATKHYVGL